MWHYGATFSLCESSLKEHIKAFRTRAFMVRRLKNRKK